MLLCSSFSDNTRSPPPPRKENFPQQINPSSIRSNREEQTRAPIRSSAPEQSASRRNEPKVNPMTTTSASPIPQRSTEKPETSPRQPPRNRSSSTAKQELRQSGANTGTEQSSPWDQPVTKSSSA